MYKDLRDSIADTCDYPKFGDLALVKGQNNYGDRLYAVIDLRLVDNVLPKYMEYRLIAIDVERLYSGKDEIEELSFSFKIYGNNFNGMKSVAKKGRLTGELLTFLEKKRTEYEMVKIIET